MGRLKNALPEDIDMTPEGDGQTSIQDYIELKQTLESA